MFYTWLLRFISFTPRLAPGALCRYLWRWPCVYICSSVVLTPSWKLPSVVACRVCHWFYSSNGAKWCNKSTVQLLLVLSGGLVSPFQVSSPLFPNTTAQLIPVLPVLPFYIPRMRISSHKFSACCWPGPDPYTLFNCTTHIHSLQHTAMQFSPSRGF